MLYRVLVAIQVWVAVSAAPQDVVNSDITYVPVQPPTDPLPSEETLQKESSIEHLPLTIPGNSEDSSIEIGEFVPTKNFTIEEKHNTTSQDVRSIEGTADIEPSGSELEEAVAPDDSFADETGPSRTFEYTTIADSGETTETTEAVTETPEVTRPKFASPRSFSLSKLGVKKKVTNYSFTANLIDKSEKRKFRSTCKCMRIWNCPKLQISVGRCSEEFFLCCF